MRARQHRVTSGQNRDRLTRPLIAAAAALLVAGCGSGSQNASPSAGTPTATTSSTSSLSASTPASGSPATGASSAVSANPTTTAPTSSGSTSGPAAQARAMATDSCQTWKLSEQQIAADSTPTLHQAAQSAASARGLDPQWAQLAQDMDRTAGLPLTDNTSAQIAQARTDLGYIQQACAGLGVTVQST